MKAIIILNFCVAFQLITISNGVRANKYIEILDKMAKKGTIIDGIFKPSENGTLGIGSYGFTYSGQFLPHNNRKVAVKFSTFIILFCPRREYEMYTYLDAIDNPTAQINGIPTIYYFGRWSNQTMMAMTLLDSTFHKTIKTRNVNQMDILIAFREFVRVIKFIHSRGIIHNDISINNMIIQNGQGFIYDFGLSLDMNEYSREENIKRAKTDLGKILRAMLDLIEPESGYRWLELWSSDAEVRMINVKNFLDELFEDANTNGETKFRGLRKIIVEFAKHVFDDDSTGSNDANGTWIPFYDQLYQIIYEECENYGIETSTAISSISHIPDPFGIDEWPRPKVDYELFENMYAEQLRAAKKKPCGCLFF